MRPCFGATNTNYMNLKNLNKSLVLIGFLIFCGKGISQITVQKDYSNKTSAPIGTFQGVKFREGGFSGLFPIPNTGGKEFWTLSDRGVNVDCGSANLAACRPTYDKMYSFPSYAPKIHRIRIQGDSVQILQSITIKRPNGTGATGIINPTGFGSTAAELASTDTVMNCANFLTKTAAKDIWGIDSEGIIVDADGNFWICEEGGPTIWKVSPNGVVIRRYTPYANLAGAQSEDVQIDTCFKYRKNNRGFENIAITPNGKIYAMIQSPLLYPTTAIGEASRIHRILEIDPISNTQKMYVYLNDGIIGTGSNQIRLKDWKTGDMAAVNDSTFLVLEAAARGTTDIKRMYTININGATAVKSGISYATNTKTLEALVDSAGLVGQGIVPVRKKLAMDLLAKGWPAAYDKAEGIAIINDSTIAISNDNDYAQTCPNADGIAIATTTTSHVVTFDLKGTDKLKNFAPNKQLLFGGLTGPTTNTTPYLVPTADGVTFTSILSAGETAANGYKMTGVPDGMGAFDNNDGTFSVVINHEIGNTASIVRAHGNIGSFVSKWIIKKSDLSVVSGQDLIKNVYAWTPTGYVLYNSANPNAKSTFTRFCAADLPSVYAFYNPVTGLGTKERIFMNGEEAGTEGRAYAHILTGSAAGTSYELPLMGKYSFENVVANPNISNKTVVVGTDDATPGQVYVYVGTKNISGTDIEKAGLTNGKLYGVAVSGLAAEVSASFPAPNTAFSLVDMGSIIDSTGASLNKLSIAKNVTNFLRPEDCAWDPSNLNDFYFATTNAITAPSRLWRLRFSDINSPEKGGTITAVLDGTEGQKMLDNLTIDNSGHIMLQEDVGSNIHNGKIWQYTIATDKLELIAKHDPNRFETGATNFLTIDEESSGMIDVQSILGNGNFLLVDQAHYPIAGEVVEGGQLLKAYIPETFKSNPEVSILGNNVEIVLGDTTPSVSDNSDFGGSSLSSNVIKTFTIKNTGIGNLNVSNIQITGIDAPNFSLVAAPSFPLTIAPNGVYSLTVRFLPKSVGFKKATIAFFNNDNNEGRYDFAISGLGYAQGSTGASSSSSPYLIGTAPGVSFTSILTAGDVVGNYTMAGTPDGAGAFDNNDGTFTMVINHEFGNTAGATRSHGNRGSFVSRWNINKSNLSVISGADQIKNVYLWDSKNYGLYNSSNSSSRTAFNRFCSGDLAPVSAFYNAKSGKGSNSRIYLNGEEAGSEGRGFAHVLTGSENGNTYELPLLGKFSYENSLANPTEQDKTIVISTDDATPGQVYVYVGTKTTTGTEVDKAGLTNGKLYGVAVSGLTAEVSASFPSPNTSFNLVDLGNIVDSTGFQLNRFSNLKGVTNFLRPEDGAWDPNNLNDFYFVTTNSFTAPSRMWKLHFDDIQNPEKGGSITAVLDGTEGQKMMDNIGFDNTGNLLVQEDVGNNVHNGKIHQYNIETDKLTQLAQHDPSRFESNGSNFLTLDEESSGMMDAQSILGPGMFLLVDQAHYAIAGEVVEGGQILTMFNPTTFNNAPEINCSGNKIEILNHAAVSQTNATDMGVTGLQNPLFANFTIKNTGKGKLIVKNIDCQSNGFEIVSAKSGKLNSDSVMVITVKFNPTATGVFEGLVTINSNDVDELDFDFKIKATVEGADVKVLSNNYEISNGEKVTSSLNGTHLGEVAIKKTAYQSFEIVNNGLSNLNVKNIKVGNSGNFSIKNVNFPMVVNASTKNTVTVEFTSALPGTFTDVVTITSDAADSIYTFNVSAEAIAPKLTISGNTNPIASGDLLSNVFNHTDFGDVGIGSQKTRVFQMENIGKEYLNIDSIAISGSSKSDFEIVYPTSQSFSIKPGKSENLMIQFGTANLAKANATVKMYSNDFKNPLYTFAISANGVVPSNVSAISKDLVKVYPNPVNNQLFIESNANIQSIEIIDLAGKKIFENNQDQLNKIEISTMNYPSGFYIVNVKSQNKVYSSKFIVQH